MVGILILIGALAIALGFGLYRRTVDGRFAAGARTPTAWTQIVDSLADSAPADLGERATLVQFSSAFCAPCRTTRVVLADVAASDSGVQHVEVDAEQHLELVRRLDIRRTPTTLVLDHTGREVGRATGAPRKQQVLDAIP